jgi:hypothetical protein
MTQAVDIAIIGLLTIACHVVLLPSSRPIDPMVMSYVNESIMSVNGVYIPDCGFFVDTRGRNVDEVNKTVTHEAAHAYIRQYGNYSHFCDKGD